MLREKHLIPKQTIFVSRYLFSEVTWSRLFINFSSFFSALCIIPYSAYWKIIFFEPSEEHEMKRERKTWSAANNTFIQQIHLAKKKDKHPFGSYAVHRLRVSVNELKVTGKKRSREKKKKIEKVLQLRHGKKIALINLKHFETHQNNNIVEWEARKKISSIKWSILFLVSNSW